MGRSKKRKKKNLNVHFFQEGWLEGTKLGISDFWLWLEHSISSGGSTSVYLIKHLSVWEETEEGVRWREGGGENIDSRASTSDSSWETDRRVIGCQSLHYSHFYFIPLMEACDMT